MWIPEEFKSQSLQMDFTSSGQTVVDVTAVYADQEKIANAVELIEFDEDPIQFHVCDHCGYTQCSPGNWLAIRKIGDHILLIPSFTNMDEGEWESREYTPPYFTRVKGSIFLGEPKYSQLKNVMSGLPVIESIKEVSSYEVSRTLQWEAPFRVLGEYASPVVFDDRLLTTTSYESDEEAVKELNQLLNRFSQESVRLELSRIKEESYKVSFFLDASEFMEWVPLVKSENRFGLVVTSDLAIFEAKKG